MKIRAGTVRSFSWRSPAPWRCVNAKCDLRTHRGRFDTFVSLHKWRLNWTLTLVKHLLMLGCCSSLKVKAWKSIAKLLNQRDLGGSEEHRKGCMDMEAVYLCSSSLARDCCSFCRAGILNKLVFLSTCSELCLQLHTSLKQTIVVDYFTALIFNIR